MVSLAQCALCDESPATSPSLLFVLLPCLHSLCTLCLGDVRSEQEGHRRNKHYYPCPSCHETFDCYDDVHVLEAGPGRPEQDEHEAAQEEPLLGDKTIEALEEHRDKVLLAIGDVEAQRRHQQALLVSLPQEIADAFERLRRDEPEYAGLLPLLHARRDLLIETARTQLATDDKTAELQLDALRVTLDQLGLALGYAATTSARADNGREWQRIIRSKVGAILGADPALLRPIVKDTLHFTLNNHNDDAWGVPVDKLGYVGRTRDFAAISRPQIILGYKGPSPGQFIAPGPVAGTLDGRWLIVFDNDGSRIQLFDIATRPADKQQQQPSALLIRVIRNVSVTNAYAVAPSSSCVAQTATAAGTDATSPLAHVVPALWVAEYNTNRVVGLSLAGQRLPGRLISCKRPVGVAVALADLSLDVLVASEEGSVIRVSSDGSTVRWTFNPRTARQIREEYLGLATNERNDLLAQPSAVALSQPDQKHVVVADKAWGRLITVDAATGKFGRYICAERTLSGPTSIACLEPNLVVVAESTAHRVSMWTLDGEHVCSWGSPNGAAPPRPDKYFGGGAAGAPPGPRQANTAALNRSANVANNPLGPGEFSRPSHVAVLADGRIAVMDSIECRVQIF